MKRLLIQAAAIYLLAATTVLGQGKVAHEMAQDTTGIDQSDCHGTANSVEGASAHHQQAGSHHFMVMAGGGIAGQNSIFQTFGVGFEHRLPAWSGRIGVGVNIMAMTFSDRTHLMLVGTGTVYPLGGLFFQVETGLGHAHNAETNTHRSALLGGVGAGYHFNVAGVMIAPTLSAEYSRVQKPTYSFVLCLGM